MGVRYERWLIARGNTFSPAAASVVKLVEKLRKEGWIGDSGAYAVKTVENTFGADQAKRLAAGSEAMPATLTKDWLEDPEREELRLVWRAVKYPLNLAPEGEVTCSLEVHRCLEYVYPSADNIDAVPSVCRCGEDLAFEWDDEELVPAFAASTGIFAECEECSRTFEPSKGTATITNPFDGTKEEVAGGAAYRFAIKVDCGKSFVKDGKLAFAPELVALMEAEFGRQFYEVGCSR